MAGDMTAKQEAIRAQRKLDAHNNHRAGLSREVFDAKNAYDRAKRAVASGDSVLGGNLEACAQRLEKALDAVKIHDAQRPE